jgi:hypothetical protein
LFSSFALPTGTLLPPNEARFTSTVQYVLFVICGVYYTV